jgi:hypothetical protein
VPTFRPLISGRVAPEEVEERTTGGGEGSKVFLFNCECHTFDEVITQLLKAVPGMTRPLAEELACSHDWFGRGVSGRRVGLRPGGKDPRRNRAHRAGPLTRRGVA